MVNGCSLVKGRGRLAASPLAITGSSSSFCASDQLRDQAAKRMT